MKRISFLILFILAFSFPVFAQDQSFQTRLAQANAVYSAEPKFELNHEATVKLKSLYQQLYGDPSFAKQSTEIQAETLHRFSYVLKVHEQQNFNIQNIDAAKGFLIQINYATQLAQIAFSKQRSVGADTARTNNLLRYLAYELEYRAIMIDAVSDCEVCNDYKQKALDYVEWVVQNTSPTKDDVILKGTRYFGQGLFIFDKKDKAQALCGIVGLAKFTNDLPMETSTANALRMVGACEYTTQELADWINSKQRHSDCESSFVEAMFALQIIAYSPGTGYVPGNAKTIMILDLAPGSFSHEFAHTVQKRNPWLLDYAKKDFAQLSKADQALFKKFMLTQNPKMDFESMMEEFFAYNLQLDDWRIGARKIVNGK